MYDSGYYMYPCRTRKYKVYLLLINYKLIMLILYFLKTKLMYKNILKLVGVTGILRILTYVFPDSDVCYKTALLQSL